jgi:small conductance mechanosensitive channel
MKDPAPTVELLEFTALGPVLAVRPFCHNDQYWDVYFETNQAIHIHAEFSEAGYSVPETRHFMRKAS